MVIPEGRLSLSINIFSKPSIMMNKMAVRWDINKGRHVNTPEDISWVSSLGHWFCALINIHFFLIWWDIVVFTTQSMTCKATLLPKQGEGFYYQSLSEQLTLVFYCTMWSVLSGNYQQYTQNACSFCLMKVGFRFLYAESERVLNDGIMQWCWCLFKSWWASDKYWKWHDTQRRMTCFSFLSRSTHGI